MRFGRCVLLLEDLRYSLPSTLVLAGLLRRLDAGREAAREDLTRSNSKAKSKKRKRGASRATGSLPTRKSTRSVAKVSYRYGGAASSSRSAIPSAPADFVLPDGFDTVFVKRKSGKQRGSEYKIYVAPDGQAFRSLVEVWRKVSGRPLQERVHFPKWAQKAHKTEKPPKKATQVERAASSSSNNRMRKKA